MLCVGGQATESEDRETEDGRGMALPKQTGVNYVIDFPHLALPAKAASHLGICSRRAVV
jgi:hypothetical protein